MHPALITLTIYYSMSCLMVCWGTFILQMGKIQGVEYSEDWTGSKIAVWWVTTVLAWPLVIHEFVKDTRVISLKKSPTPRCLKCGSDDVIRVEFRERKIASDYDKNWRKNQLDKGVREWTLDSRGKDETPFEYARNEKWFYERNPWGKCAGCGTKLGRDVVEKNWSNYC